MRRGRCAWSRVAPPYVYLAVKSKCYTTGAKTCTKVGHSCCRRICSGIHLPQRWSWRALGRGLEALVKLVGDNSETFAMCDVGRTLADGLAALPGGLGRCRCCGEAMLQPSLVSFDVDQAFEQCSLDESLPAFDELAEEFFCDDTGLNSSV